MNKLEQSADQEARHSHKERADRLVEDLRKVAEALVDNIGRVAELEELLWKAYVGLLKKDGSEVDIATEIREALETDQ